jgi:hypothetical protein
MRQNLPDNLASQKRVAANGFRGVVVCGCGHPAVVRGAGFYGKAKAEIG